MQSRDNTKRGGAKAGRRRWKPALLCADIDGRRKVFTGRAAEAMHSMLTRGSVSAAELQPGVRLAATIFRLRHELLVPIVSNRFCTSKGDGEFASYSISVPADLREWRPGEWVRDGKADAA